MPTVLRTNGRYFGNEINFSILLNDLSLKAVSYSQMGELDNHINVPHVWPKEFLIIKLTKWISY